MLAFADDKNQPCEAVDALARVHLSQVDRKLRTSRRCGPNSTGSCHHLPEAHLGRYTAEFDFRYNTRLLNDHERADVCLQGIADKRLTYRRTDAIAA